MSNRALANVERDPEGRFVALRAALDRFRDYCRFDPETGCVIWCGGKVRGRGKTRWYGAFWFEGRARKAHRWAAQHIHGLDIDGLEVDHECGNTLCVQHLQTCTGQVNREWYWIRVQVGLLEEEPDREPESAGIPFYEPPAWLPRQPQPTDCPF